MRKNIIFAMLAGLLLTACYNEGTLVDNPAAVMRYQHKPTEARLLAMTLSYAKAINSNLEEGVVHPGQYADYGVALARLGCTRQANVMFNNEKMLFPNSSRYIDLLKQTLAPTYASETICDTSKIDLHSFDTLHITLTPEEMAQQRALESDPEYKKMIKEQQQQERAQQAEAKKALQKETAKAKAAEREARAKEKAAADKAKAKAKKAEQKAKEKAKADAAKAKKQEQKAKEQAKRDAIKAKKQAEKEALKAQQEAQKAAAQAEKEALKAQQEAEKAAAKAEKEAAKAAAKAEKKAASTDNEEEQED